MIYLHSVITKIPLFIILIQETLGDLNAKPEERYEIIPPTMASKPFDIYNILPSRASSYYQLPAVTQSASSYLTVNDYQQPLIRPSSYTLPSTRSYQVYPGIVSEQLNNIGLKSDNMLAERIVNNEEVLNANEYTPVLMDTYVAPKQPDTFSIYENNLKLDAKPVIAEPLVLGYDHKVGPNIQSKINITPMQSAKTVLVPALRTEKASTFGVNRMIQPGHKKYYYQSEPFTGQFIRGNNYLERSAATHADYNEQLQNGNMKLIPIISESKI